MRFWLGVHHPDWLERTDVPLFVSRTRLQKRRSLPVPHGAWALDSGAFTELSLNGAWTLSAQQYVAQVRRFKDEMPGLQWAAPQDWMCEPEMVERTGRSIAEHQALTVANFCELRLLAPDLPFIPVLQGFELDDYLACVERYESHGVDLTAEPLVGLGTVCRRQGAVEAGHIVRRLVADGLSLHAFGVKLTGLQRFSGALASADSMAWSFDARRTSPLPGCPHRSCANCLRYALRWRDQVETSLGQLALEEAA